MAAPMPRAPPVTMATLLSSLPITSLLVPERRPDSRAEVAGERRPHALRPQRAERPREGARIGRVVGEIAENVAHGEEGPGVAARRLRGRPQPVPARVVRQNDLAALGLPVA